MNQRLDSRNVPLRSSFIHVRDLVDYAVVLGYFVYWPATSHSEGGVVVLSIGELPLP